MSALTLVLLAACLSSGTALRCYSCVSDDADDYCSNSKIRNGNTNPGICSIQLPTGNGFMDSVQRAFNHNLESAGLDIPQVCQKLVYTSLNGKKRIKRQCALQSMDVCNTQAGTETLEGRLDYCGVCDYDGCNSAGRLHGNYVWLLPLLALLWRH